MFKNDLAEALGEEGKPLTSLKTISVEVTIPLPYKPLCCDRSDINHLWKTRWLILKIRQAYSEPESKIQALEKKR